MIPRFRPGAHRCTVLFALMVGLAAGCGGKPTSAPALSTAPPPSAAPKPAPPGAPAPGQIPVPPPTVTTQSSNESEYSKEMEQTLNDFLGEYVRSKKRIPKDIGEMVGLGIITSIPALPAGKKWVIDQQTGRISAR